MTIVGYYSTFVPFLCFLTQFVGRGSALNDKEAHGSSDSAATEVFLGCFFAFIILIILFHCYLKRKHKRYIDNLERLNMYNFAWEDGDDV